MREELTDTVSIMNPISYQTSRSMLELVEDKLCELADEYDHARLEEFERYEETVKTLLEIRRYMIIGSNHMDEAGIRMVKDFNNALRNALTELYHEAQDVYSRLKDMAGKDIYISAKLWIDDEYPSTMADQSDRAKRIWELLLNPDLNTMYEDGCDNGVFEPTKSLNHYLYLSEHPEDWSEDIVGLFDCQLPNDLKMVYAAHNLGSHSFFTIFELMHVRKFKKEIIVDIDEKDEDTERTYHGA